MNLIRYATTFDVPPESASAGLDQRVAETAEELKTIRKNNPNNANRRSSHV